MNSILLVVLGFLSLCLYLVYARLHSGEIQNSISESYYHIKHKYLFTFAIWINAFLYMIASNSEFIFIAGSLISFVGASPAFKDRKMENIVHLVGSIGGFVLAVAAIAFAYKAYLLLGLTLIGLALLYKFAGRTKIYWIEVWISFCLGLTLIIDAARG